MSQYVFSVETSSPINHRSYPWFVSFLYWLINGLGNLHAEQMLRTSAEAAITVGLKHVLLDSKTSKTCLTPTVICY